MSAHRRNRHPAAAWPGAALAAVLSLQPAASHAESQLTQIGQEVALGSNLNDEACRLRLTGTAPNEFDRRNYSMFCEGWTRPSGTMASFKVRSLTPKDFLTSGNIAEQIEVRLAECTPAADSKI